jgi:regulator of replication initiation timing
MYNQDNEAECVRTTDNRVLLTSFKPLVVNINSKIKSLEFDNDNLHYDIESLEEENNDLRIKVTELEKFASDLEGIISERVDKELSMRTKQLKLDHDRAVKIGEAARVSEAKARELLEIIQRKDRLWPSSDRVERIQVELAAERAAKKASQAMENVRWNRHDDSPTSHDGIPF